MYLNCVQIDIDRFIIAQAQEQRNYRGFMDHKVVKEYADF